MMTKIVISIVAALAAAFGIKKWWEWEDPFLKNVDRLTAMHDRYAYGREYDIYS